MITDEQLQSLKLALEEMARKKRRNRQSDVADQKISFHYCVATVIASCPHDREPWMQRACTIKMAHQAVCMPGQDCRLSEHPGHL